MIEYKLVTWCSIDFLSRFVEDFIYIEKERDITSDDIGNIKRVHKLPYPFNTTYLDIQIKRPSGSSYVFFHDGYVIRGHFLVPDYLIGLFTDFNRAVHVEKSEVWELKI
jgi:hypothetical protein